jgi:hypothetical protein
LHALSSPGIEIIPISTDDEVIANADIAFGDLPDKIGLSKRTILPLPVAPDFIFNRLLAIQNGTFTIHGEDTLPLE